MPTYNYAQYLPQAIESVLGQIYNDFELLIIDDASCDSTREVVRGYAAVDDRIVYAENERNMGMVENWNLCLSRAKGTYIKFLFGDDLLGHPEALGRMVSAMESDDEVSLVGSPRLIIDENSQVLGRVSNFPEWSVFTGTDVVRDCLSDLRNPNLIGEPSVVMFRASLATAGFNPAYHQLVDLEMWFRLLEKGRYVHLGEALSIFRVHGKQQTSKNVLSLAYMDDLALLFDEYLQKEYIGFGTLRKTFLAYHQFYKIWKKARQKKIDKETARRKILSRYRPWEFYAIMPIYKLYSPLFKIFVASKACALRRRKPGSATAIQGRVLL